MLKKQPFRSDIEHARALKKSPTKNILTECAACGMQIEHISGCVVRHPIKIMADCYVIE